MQKIILTLISFILTCSCSLKGKDVLLLKEEISKEVKYFQFDSEYFTKTKNLRKKYPHSLHAHISYISARDGVKAVATEYTTLSNKFKKPLYQYLEIRAKLGTISRRDRAQRTELIDQLETLALNNKEIKNDALYDLSSNLISDKKKVQKYAIQLLKEKPSYSPYKVLRAKTLQANDEADKILDFCEDALKQDKFDIRLCQNISTITSETANKYKERRDQTLKKMVTKVLKVGRKSDIKSMFHKLNSLVEEEANKSNVKELFFELVSENLKKNPNWIPYEGYRKYYGDMNYNDFSLFLKMGKISKILDFKNRINELKLIAEDKNNSTLIRSSAYSNIGHAYLNPANLDKEKAYLNLKESHNIKAGDDYLLGSYISLLIELKKDPSDGFSALQGAIERIQTKMQNYLSAGANNPKELIASLQSTMSSLLLLEGRLNLLKKEHNKAKLAFLNSYNADDTEEAAFFLGEVYLEENPMIALDFYLKSISLKSENAELNEAFKIRRDKAIEQISSQFLGGKFDQKMVLEQYKDNKSDKDQNKPHPLIGKELLKEQIIDFRGGNFDWEKLTGKRVILSFWATWCTPCFQEMAVLNKLKKDGKLKNLKIVGVCTDGLSQKKKVKKIVKDGGIEFEILLDDGTFRDKYSISVLPSMFFLNEKGNFIKFKTGYTPDLENEIFKVFK